MTEDFAEGSLHLSDTPDEERSGLTNQGKTHLPRWPAVAIPTLATALAGGAFGVVYSWAAGLDLSEAYFGFVLLLGVPVVALSFITLTLREVLNAARVEYAGFITTTVLIATFAAYTSGPSPQAIVDLGPVWFFATLSGMIGLLTLVMANAAKRAKWWVLTGSLVTALAMSAGFIVWGGIADHRYQVGQLEAAGKDWWISSLPGYVLGPTQVLAGDEQMVTLKSAYGQGDRIVIQTVAEPRPFECRDRDRNCELVADNVWTNSTYSTIEAHVLRDTSSTTVWSYGRGLTIDDLVTVVENLRLVPAHQLVD